MEKFLDNDGLVALFQDVCIWRIYKYQPYFNKMEIGFYFFFFLVSLQFRDLPLPFWGEQVAYGPHLGFIASFE